MVCIEGHTGIKGKGIQATCKGNKKSIKVIKETLDDLGEFLKYGPSNFDFTNMPWKFILNFTEPLGTFCKICGPLEDHEKPLEI